MSKLEVAIIAKAKQGYIYRYMLENNMTASELARRIGINPSAMGRMINFQWLPNKNKRQSRELIKKFETYFNMSIEVLFPPELTEEIREKLGRKHVHFQEFEFLRLEDIQPKYLSYDLREEEAIKEQSSEIQKALKTLKPKEEEILKKRFGFNGEAQTLIALAKEYKVTPERMRQIENKALRKLQHHKRRSILEGVMN